MKTEQAKPKIYVAPSANRKNGIPNRYFRILKEELIPFFDVLEADNAPCLMQGLALIRNSLRADVCLLSFVETIPFHKLGFIQYLMAILSLAIMKLRKCVVMFVFHNPRPHQGENWMTRSLIRKQLAISEAVISHSKECASLAREMLSASGKDVSSVHYVCHPLYYTSEVAEVEKNDEILIWGNILPYKGVLEFVSSDAVRDAGLKVRIVGQCKDADLDLHIRQALSIPSATSFIYENRLPDFPELSRLIPASRWVLFPYLPGSISSSGVLMDTISMGGNPIGPAVGAFLDLEEEGMCAVYHSEQEMVGLLKSNGNTMSDRRKAFMERNSWHSFAEFISNLYHHAR